MPYKPFDCFSVQMTVCHLDTDLRQIILLCIDIRITFCLGKMDIDRRFQIFQIPEHAFYLIYGDIRLFFLFPDDDPVRTSFDLKHIPFTRNPSFQRDLRMIFRSHFSLYPAMHLSAEDHRIFFYASGYPVVDASFSQDKLDKVSDRYPDHFIIFPHLDYSALSI